MEPEVRVEAVQTRILYGLNKYFKSLSILINPIKSYEYLTSGQFFGPFD